MKHELSSTAGIIGFAIGLLAAPALAQTTANGPYYATPSWDQQLPASTRFIVLSNWGSAAVLDRETGLVWERTPSTDRFMGAEPEGSFGASTAMERCVELNLGNRLGWRVPSVQELLSLVDKTQSSPALPAGHPFTLNLGPTNSDADRFWTSTAYISGIDQAALRTVNLKNGAQGATGSGGGVFRLRVWCVRGGSGNPNQ